MGNVEKIAKYLRENNFKLSITESCTGGLISSLFTDVAGASGYIEQNFVTYSAASKIAVLGVCANTIEKYGVVSEKVALEMAHGLIVKWGADFALSTTGVLGPRVQSGPQGNIPVGTVFIGLASKHKEVVLKAVKYVSDKKTRTQIKRDIAQLAIKTLCDYVLAV